MPIEIRNATLLGTTMSVFDWLLSLDLTSCDIVLGV